MSHSVARLANPSVPDDIRALIGPRPPMTQPQIVDDAPEPLLDDAAYGLLCNNIKSNPELDALFAEIFPENVPAEPTAAPAMNPFVLAKDENLFQL